MCPGAYGRLRKLAAQRGANLSARTSIGRSAPPPPPPRLRLVSAREMSSRTLKRSAVPSPSRGAEAGDKLQFVVIVSYDYFLSLWDVLQIFIRSPLPSPRNICVYSGAVGPAERLLSLRTWIIILKHQRWRPWTKSAWRPSFGGRIRLLAALRSVFMGRFDGVSSVMFEERHTPITCGGGRRKSCRPVRPHPKIIPRHA